MNIETISLTAGMVLKLFSVYFIVISLFAVARQKRLRPADPATRFAVVIAARNEEAVIGQLVESLKAQDYPQALRDIYVVPNNCTDDTRGAALRAGANIIDCNAPVRAKGDALRQAFTALGAKGYDAYCVFDADNVVDPGFLREMNNAFCAGAKVAKGRNEAKNPYDSWISGCYGIYFGIFNHFYNPGRAVLGMSAKLIGTGFAVSSGLLDEMGGWQTETIAEDAEFSTLLALAGQQVWWVPRAVTYDEEPVSFAVSLRQRKRWCSGIMQVSRLKLPHLIKAQSDSGRRLRIDSIMFLLSPFVQVLSFVPMAITTVGLAIDGAAGLWGIALSLGTGYLGATAAAAVIVTVSGRWNRRIIKSVLTFAIFMASWLPLQLYSLVKKTTRWEEIPHSHTVALGKAAWR